MTAAVILPGQNQGVLPRHSSALIEKISVVSVAGLLFSMWFVSVSCNVTAFVGNPVTAANVDVFSRVLTPRSLGIQLHSALGTQLYLHFSALQQTLQSGVKC